jgi:quercetin dioxygenase-like cupin family protein
MKTPGLHIFPLTHGLLYDQSKGMYPSRCYGYDGSKLLEVGTEASTLYGYVQEGEIKLSTEGQTWRVKEGYYFSTVGITSISGSGKAVVIERIGYQGVFQIGGPIEEKGRLAYIDGCSDSVLIHPARLGDPSFNMLTFPTNTRQTMHIHPTVRMGVVAKGEGRCVTRNREIPLFPGAVFILEEMEQHCFYTSDSSMTVITYHPDSESGPTDETHSMLKNTIFTK